MINKKRQKQLILNFLIMPYEDGYMALCRETGLIRSGRDLDGAYKAIESATKTLLEAVQADKKLQPSLRVGLPIAYRILFYWTVFKILFNNAMDNLLFVRKDAFDLQFGAV